MIETPTRPTVLERPARTAPGYRLEIEPIAPGAQDVSGYLTPSERKQYFAFRFDKRRREWLAGRIAAKRLIRKTIEESGLIVTEDEIKIERTEAGEPFVRSLPAPWPLSISHSGEWAGAAMGDGTPPARIGLDIEKIEPRDPAWLEIAFDACEYAGDLSEAEQTLLWTRKEAVSKLLGIGLSADLRDIRFEAVAHAPPTLRPLDLRAKAQAAWAALGRPKIRFDSPKLLPGYAVTVAYSTTSEEELHGQ